MTTQLTKEIAKAITHYSLTSLLDEKSRYTHLLKGDWDREDDPQFIKSLERYDEYIAILREIHRRIIVRGYSWELLPLEQIQATIDEELK